MRTDSSSDIREMMEENIKLSREILEVTKKTHKHAQRAEIIAVLRILIIAIPIILAILYIPPFLSKYSSVFGELFGGDQSNIFNLLKGQSTGGLNIDDVKSLIDQQIKK